MAIKKTALYSSLWASCDELRGGMDASQYKDYVLTFLFLKYISDKYAGDPDALLVVPEGCSFKDLVALAGDKEIGEKINKIIAKLAEENGLKGVIDVADFNDEDKLGKGKAMQDRLSKLVQIFNGLDLRANRADGDDLLGDAYEYLMRHFATESGKSKGQFYTPAEVSRILAKVIGIKPDTSQDQTVYDPTCGSGSLLLKVADEAPRGLSIYGQEMDNATAALAKMNMILHDCPTAEIWKDNTLAAPQWKDKDGSLQKFDFAVANPPFSFKAWRTGLNPDEDEFQRFEYGVPPDKNGDYAFLLHILKSLKSTGKAAVILPHGVLFRGNAEGRIRENLVKQGYIKGIIGLPANLFYGTGIPACIIVLDKENHQSRTGLFMVNASLGFMKDGNKNRLRSQDIHKIVDVFNHQIPLDGYSKMVTFKQIKDNDYNLNIPRYIDSSEPEDKHDLHAHMNGGIPKVDIDALQHYWDVFPQLRSALFEAGESEGYRRCLVEASQVKTTILTHPEFEEFAAQSMARFTAWCTAHEECLKGIAIGGDDSKELIAQLAEDLLQRFADAPLLDKYDIYQLLMDYWAETMQDDVYVLAQDGWGVGNVLRELIPEKDKKGKKVYREKADFEIAKKKFKADLIPPALVIARYFSDKQDYIDQLQTAHDEAKQTLETFIEESSGDEGLLEDAKTEKGSVTKTSVNARLKELKLLPDDDEEKAAVSHCLELITKEAAAKKAVKDSQDALDKAVFGQYPMLSEDDIKLLAVEDKWLSTLQAAIQTEVERVTQSMAERVKQLEERYAEPLPDLLEELETLSSSVDEYLKKMGVAW